MDQRGYGFNATRQSNNAGIRNGNNGTTHSRNRRGNGQLRRNQGNNTAGQLNTQYASNKENGNTQSPNGNRNRGYKATGNNKARFQRDGNENRGNQQPRSNGSNRANRTFKMGFRAAQDLEANEDVEMIVETLMNDRRGFKETLNDDKLSGDFIILILQLLKKVSQTTFMSSKTSIFNMVFIDSSYLEQLRVFILDLPDHNEADKHQNNFFWKNTDKFWHTFLEVFGEIMKIPTLASQILPKLLQSTMRIIPVLEDEHSIQISDGIIQQLKIMLTAVKNMATKKVERYQSKPVSTNKSEYNEDNLVPPNDFRTIPIYPNVIEVISRDQPFLRKNKIKGPYVDVEHYLDVQFRLLREDFIAPLRKGICQYIDHPDQNRFDDIKIHKQVKFLNEENINEMKCFRIKFDFSNKKRKLIYENSKQFMYGSLICFTNDRFVNIIFGKIVKRDADMIKKGELIVGFDEDVDISYHEIYIMAESTVYFEPYYHVLTVLQGVQGDKFPLEDYIIYADSRVGHPKFMNVDTVYRIDGREVHPLFWPYDKFYTFNESQQKAFRAALTHELSVIQGPPGTGKTFLGLKIAQVLLRNYHVWYKNSPLLVICFTNHALDQFLEGLLNTTHQIVRVGSRSKNENLNEFNLNKKKRGKKSGHFYQLKTEMKSILYDLKSLDNHIAQLNMNNSIVEFRYFHDIPGFAGTWFSKATDEDIKKWLLSYATTKHIDTYRENAVETETAGPSYEEDDDELSELSDHEEPDDDLFKNISLTNTKYLISLPTLSSEIKVNESILRNPNLEHEREFRAIKLQQLRREHDYVKKMLGQFRQSRGRFCNWDPHNMTENERWHLYKYWCTQYLDKLTRRRVNVLGNYQATFKLYCEAREMDDLKVLRENLVVGMTTTSAARLRMTLEAMQSPIVIVEEAAEVLEAHITSSLTTSCNQLILIGDHQQLKPTTADYQVEKEYLMGVSLFERLINNKVECHTLNIQHRMRPDICNLIRPAIYQDLRDHESVEGRSRIVGVEKHLFFLHHTQQEEMCGDTSRKNIHEAKFLISLARYLILNGYKPENITILAAYLGQMFEMKREKDKHSLIMKDVRISVLDNYQGEESDIVLLSLVRNNKDNVNGFLKIENRVCVALSRARNGLYIMGNMEQLCHDSGTVWLKVKERLVEQDALGTYLELRCQIHNKITRVTTAEDFHNVSEGGCDSLCNAKLACGHFCKNVCHFEDRDHHNYDCLEKCGRALCQKYENHICIDKCFMTCRPCYYPVKYNLRCGHQVTLECHVETYKCIERVPTILPCGHLADKPCHYKSDEFPCPHPCDTRVEPCGHACTLNCHIRDDPDHYQYKCKKPCASIRTGCSTQDHFCRNLCYEECEVCITIIPKRRTLCTHVYKLPCNENVDELKCEKPCNRKLSCGHICRNICCETCGPCKIKVRKVIPECGHEVVIMCHELPGRQYCKQNCERILNCGHKCVEKCNKSCTSRCNEMKRCNLLSPCHHTVTKIKCHENLLPNDKGLLKYCTKPCEAILKCKHRCRGTCGECSQGRIHMRCMEECGVPLICNHICPIPCREACKPCEKNCIYSCEHSKCKKKCGDICVKCNERCPRRCVHQECKNKCGEICSVGPCKKPCLRRLKCGHDCVGHCSDPCPSLCRICDNEKLTEIFFGTEDDEGARFVELQDCKHVFESESLENWFSGEGEIQAKVCPRCKTSIVNTQRYSDYIKTALADINKVKIMSNGSFKENDELRRNLLTRINLMKNKKLVVMGGVLSRTLSSLEERLLDTRTSRGVTKRQYFNKILLNSLTMKIQIFENILINCNPLPPPLPTEILLQLDFILNCLTRDTEQITEQETDDIQMEIFRLKRLVEIAQIRLRNKMYYTMLSTSSDTTLHSIQEEVLTFLKYSEKLDEEIKAKLKKLNCGIQISESERIEIVKAMGLAKGHWFKCPNGHPYYIGDCGGAMVVSTCNECGAKIGGGSHTLLSTNQLASEMDGATHAAWSEAANMNNYHL